MALKDCSSWQTQGFMHPGKKRNDQARSKAVQICTTIKHKQEAYLARTSVAVTLPKFKCMEGDDLEMDT